MNRKKSKQVNKLSVDFVVEWLKSMLIEEEKKKVSSKNQHKYLPKDTHVYANKRYIVSAYTPRWFAKRIKKALRKKDINDITYSDVI